MIYENNADLISKYIHAFHTDTEPKKFISTVCKYAKIVEIKRASEK